MCHFKEGGLQSFNGNCAPRRRPVPSCIGWRVADSAHRGFLRLSFRSDGRCELDLLDAWTSRGIDQEIVFGDSPVTVPSRGELLQRFYPYLEQKLREGMPLSKVVRHLMGLYHAQPNGRLWRRYLSDHAFRKDAGVEVIERAARQVE